MSKKNLATQPHLEHLKNEAKSLFKAFQKNDPTATTRFRDSHPQSQKQMTLVDAQHVLALEYGFDNWSELKAHVASVQGDSPHEDSKPTYKEAIAYYLREDVSNVLWEMSLRRQLRFYYHAEPGVNFREYQKSKVTTLHCLPTREAFCDAIARVTDGITECADSFFPFFRMERYANAPGEPNRMVGLSLGFEIDKDLTTSFRELFPLVAVLDHFGISHLTKYSGHRSLHVYLPSEAFPDEMNRSAPEREWVSALNTIGRFLRRLVPQLPRWDLAKHMALTAPYSLHRYNGLISLPLSFSEAQSFQPETASLSQFQGVRWHPKDMESSGEGVRQLIDLAIQSEENFDSVLQTAQDVFQGAFWEGYCADVMKAEESRDAIEAAFRVGLVGVNFLPEDTIFQQRLRQALMTIDHPDQDRDAFRWDGEKEHIKALIRLWIADGLAAAFQYLCDFVDEEPADGAGIAKAVLLFSYLPESPETVCQVLNDAWDQSSKSPETLTIFLVALLAELSAAYPEALDVIASNAKDEGSDQYRERLLDAPSWKLSKRPDLAIAALCLAFGAETVKAWHSDLENPQTVQFIGGIFGYPHGRRQTEVAIKKFKYTAPKVFVTDAE